MDIRSLQQFQHLATSLNYSKTAAATFVSPPTLTRIIMRLEDELGVSLFKRNNRNVALTQAGRRLLVFAEETLYNYYLMQSDFKQQHAELSGELSLYCSVTAAQTYLPNILDQMRVLHPLVDIKLETGDHELALSRLTAAKKEETADIAIAIHTPDFPANIQFQAIDTVPLTLIVSMVSLGLGIGFVPRLVLENSTAKTKVQSIEVNNIEAYRLGLCYLKERANERLIQSIAGIQ